MKYGQLVKYCHPRSQLLTISHPFVDRHLKAHRYSVTCKIIILRTNSSVQQKKNTTTEIPPLGPLTAALSPHHFTNRFTTSPVPLTSRGDCPVWTRDPLSAPCPARPPAPRATLDAVAPPAATTPTGTQQHRLSPDPAARGPQKS